MGGSLHNSSNIIKKNVSDSKFNRVRRLVLNEFSGKIFNSRDAQVSYFDAYQEKIPLSTISTYLSRLSDRGLLNRGGSSGEWHYALAYKGENTYI